MDNQGDPQPRPLSSLTDIDFKNYLNDCIKTFAHESHAQIAKTVRAEVSAAVASLQETQSDMAADLEATKSKVSEMVADYSETKAQVNKLELTFQQFLSQGSNTHP